MSPLSGCGSSSFLQLSEVGSLKKDLYRREGKGRCCCLGDRIYSIPCCACCFSSYRPGAIHPFLYIVLVQFSLFFISSWYNYSFSLYRLGAVNPFLKIIQSRCKTASAVKKLNKFCPLNSSDDLCLLFCINPYPIGGLHLPPPGGGAGGQLGQETPCGRSQVRSYCIYPTRTRAEISLLKISPLGIQIHHSKQLKLFLSSLARFFI